MLCCLSMSPTADANQLTETPAPGSTPDLGLVHPRPTFAEHWTIPEGPVAEADWHYCQVKDLRSVLDHWLARTRRNAKAYCNLAIKVRQDMPQVGFDPDVYLVEPPPPDPKLRSLRLWKPGHVVPSLVIEIVSPRHLHKDYRDIPLQCAAVGVKELVVFDPLLAGPKAGEGPQLMHLWREQSDGTFLRVAYGRRPVYSTVLGAFFVVVGEGPELRIADDHLGQQLWPTAEEAAMAACRVATAAYQREHFQMKAALEEKKVALEEKKAALEEKKAALEKNDALVARVTQLEAELNKRDP